MTFITLDNDQFVFLNFRVILLYEKTYNSAAAAYYSILYCL